ncbi:MAG: hypothetical protein MJ187_00790 [Alphaproteobacteria bacterium]|nr:hypothetical protein [Alphaproteobacteria bacterium]
MTDISVIREHLKSEIKNIPNGSYNAEQKQIACDILDSAKEKVVSDALKNWFQMLPVQVWGKNQTSGNIFGEYLDDFNNNKKSYFDFVIKFINGNYLYLEVKGDDDSDIDKNKTNMLATAYKDFFDNMNYGLFMQKFVICILRVDKYNNIVPECFYDSSIIKTDLTGASLQTIIKELIK